MTFDLFYREKSSLSHGYAIYYGALGVYREATEDRKQGKKVQTAVKKL